MLGRVALLKMLDTLDPADAVAVRRFNSLAFAYIWKQQPVVLSGDGFVTVRLPWPDGPHLHTVTR